MSAADAVAAPAAALPSLDAFERSLHLSPSHAPIQPVQSPQDARAYRVITLPNALTALLVSDPTTDKAAASLDVNIGSFAEPSEALGLAHFLEHMLFMGTEKYPDENSYSLVINNNGGSQNAYTTREHTNYIFDVTKDHLADVLDRFANFFIAPLCAKDAVARELLAVNNEHEKNLQSDVWRLNQLAESALNPAHPISRFATGNFLTLRDEPKAAGIDIREMLLEFYKATYSANLMKLCVVGAEPLDTLEEYVRRSFAGVPNHSLPRPDYTSIPIALPAHLCTLTRAVPVKNHRSLELEWLLPPSHHLYLANPGKLVAHCLAHEAEGSLAHLLKSRALINELRSGSPEQNSSYSVFNVQIELTESGLERVEEIITLTFSYIAMLRRSLREQPDNWRVDIREEVAATAAIEFQFRDKIEPVYYAEDLAARMSSVPAEHVLCPNLIRAYDHSLLETLVDQLASVREHFRARVVAPEFKSLPGLQKEKWYQTEHTVEPMSASLLASLESPPEEPSFHLPARNPFLSSNFCLKHVKNPDVEKAHQTAPKKLQCNCKAPVPEAVAVAAADPVSPVPAPVSIPGLPVPGLLPVELYFHPDTAFAQPKAHISIQLASTVCYSSPRAHSLAALWQDVLDDALSDINHFASEGLLGSYCWPTPNGLNMSFSGFDEKLPLLAAAVLPKMRGLRVAGVRDAAFARLKEQMARSLRQYSKNTPLQHARDDARTARLETSWSVDEQLQTFDSITAADVDAYAAEFFRAAQVFVLVSGNMTEEEATRFAVALQDCFNLQPLLPAQQPYARCVDLSPEHVYVRQQLARNADDSNSAVMNVYQIDRANDVLEAHLTLIAHILADALFDQLRTKETLGYLVQGYQSRLAGVLHYQIAVQSSDADAGYLNLRVEAFLAWFRSSKLASLIAETPDFLAQNIAACMANLTEKDKSIGDAHQRLWGEIEKRRFEWNHSERVAKEVGKITLDSLHAFWDKYLAIQAPQRKKMSFQYSAHAHAAKVQAPRLERDTEESVAVGNKRLEVKQTAPSEGAADGSASAGAAAAPVDSLPPAVVDPRPIVHLDDLVAFKRGQKLFPAGM